jgi:hypothetical protein
MNAIPFFSYSKSDDFEREEVRRKRTVLWVLDTFLGFD